MTGPDGLTSWTGSDQKSPYARTRARRDFVFEPVEPVNPSGPADGSPATIAGCSTCEPPVFETEVVTRESLEGTSTP